MSRPEPDSVISVGARWATRVTSIGLEFALPALLGGYLDRRWGTGTALTIAGAILGFLVGMFHILAIARETGVAIVPHRKGASPPGRGSNDGSNESGWNDHG